MFEFPELIEHKSSLVHHFARYSLTALGADIAECKLFLRHPTE